MDSIKCTACGNDIPAESTVCPFCGASVAPHETPDVAQATSATSDPASDPTSDPISVPAPALRPPKTRYRRPAWVRVICGFFSTILLIVAIALGIAAGALHMVLYNISPTNIKRVTSGVTSGETETTVRGHTQTVADTVHDAFNEAQKQIGNVDQIVDPAQVDELLQADFVQNYLSDIANSLLQDLLENTSDTSLTPEDVGEFIEDNRQEIEEILEVEVTDEIIGTITEELEKTQALEKISVSKIVEEAPVLQTVAFVVSGGVVSLLFAGMLFCLLLIALINFFRPIALSYAGAAFLTVGGLFGIVALFTDILTDILADLLDLPISLLDLLARGIVDSAQYIFAIGFTIGLVLIVGAIVYSILCSIFRAKMNDR